MKNIFTLSIILCCFGLVNPAFAQVDENSRTPEQLAKKRNVTPTTPAITATSRNGEDDGDEGQYADDAPSEAIDIFVVAEKMKALEEMVYLLQIQNEQLSAEVLAANRKTDLCCSSSTKLTANGGYLLQNSPNPFYHQSKISYVLPEGHGLGQIDIRTLDGKILKTFPVRQQGVGAISVESAGLEPGTYVYSLTINGAVVDSKIMMLTK